MKTVSFLIKLILLRGLGLLRAAGAWELESGSWGKKCGERYYHRSFQGPFLTLLDGLQVSDLSSFQRFATASLQQQLGNGFRNASRATSFRLGSNCSIKLSTGSYLSGEIKEFSTSVENLPAERLTPKSAICECERTCRCEDFKLRRSECGRAYVEKSCTKCNSPFVPLSGGSVTQRLPSKWAANVSSIVLKDGCEVELNLRSSGGDKMSRKFSSRNSRVIQDVSSLGRIEDYRCRCLERRNNGRSVSQPENPNYPSPIEIPESKRQISEMVSQPELKDHSGLLAALQSLSSKRSSRNAYVLLLGLTGSGKSTTINFLFDHPNITKIGDFTSTTSEIHEFSIPVPVPHLGMRNTALHIIDTPGIADTRGLDHDARFLATLDGYLSNHRDLGPRVLPNVVLIFAKFTNNRYQGEGASFVKMLRTIDFFKDKIIDRQSTNVVFVLTHAMSEARDVLRDPSERIERFRKVIEEFSTLPRPIHIVLAENKELHDLQSINGYFRLPFGEFYPKNLFDAMLRNMRLSRDPVGEAVIRTGFANSDEFQVSSKVTPLLPKSNAKVSHYLSVLSSYNSPVAATPVSQLLERAHHNMSDSLKQKFPQVLHPLQRTLNRKNILNLENLPQTTGEILRLMEDVELNSASGFLLREAFNFTLPHFSGNLFVGQGYSLAQDKPLHKTVIEMGELQPTDLLFMMPQALAFKRLRQSDNCFQAFPTKEKYVEGRMAALGLASDVLPTSAYLASLQDHPCFNIISLESDAPASLRSLSATANYYSFQMGIKKGSRLSPEFLRSLTALRPLDLGNDTSVSQWATFFSEYGTHVVTQARGGGSIEIKTTIVATGSMDPAGKVELLSGALANITKVLANELIGNVASFTLEPSVRYEIFLRGGSNHLTTGPFNLTSWDIDAWKDSIKYDPVVLPSTLLLTPVSEVAKQMGGGEVPQEINSMIEDAAINLLNISLVYIPLDQRPQPRSATRSPEERSETTSTLSGGVGGEYELMRGFATMFKEMSEQMRRTQEELVGVLRDAKEREQAEEKRWREDSEKSRQDHNRRTELILKQMESQTEMENKRLEMEEKRMRQEMLMKAQMQKERLQAEARRHQESRRVEQQNQQKMFQVIHADNERRARNQMMANMHRRDDGDKTFRYVMGGVSTLFNGIGSLVRAGSEAKARANNSW